MKFTENDLKIIKNISVFLYKTDLKKHDMFDSVSGTEIRAYYAMLNLIENIIVETEKELTKPKPTVKKKKTSKKVSTEDKV